MSNEIRLGLKLRMIWKITGMVFSKKKYRAIQIITSSLFALAYMVFTGIFIFTQRAIPNEFPIPYFLLSSIQTPVGIIPWWVVIYLDRHLIFSMTFEAMALTAAISTLVGINMALLIFRLRTPCHNICKSSKSSLGFFGIIPAFLSIFACCGGGVLVMLFGGAILTSLFPFGDIFGIVSIVILGAGLYLSSKELGKILHVNFPAGQQ